MTLEILKDGSTRVTGSSSELRTLAEHFAVAVRGGSSHAPFVAHAGVAELAVERELPAD